VRFWLIIRLQAPDRRRHMYAVSWITNLLRYNPWSPGSVILLQAFGGRVWHVVHIVVMVLDNQLGGLFLIQCDRTYAHEQYSSSLVSTRGLRGGATITAARNARDFTRMRKPRRPTKRPRTEHSISLEDFPTSSTDTLQARSTRPLRALLQARYLDKYRLNGSSACRSEIL
jgi:hypothetical protein